MVNNPSQTNKAATSFYLDRELFQRLVKEAEGERRTYSQQMNLILAERYKKEKK